MTSKRAERVGDVGADRREQAAFLFQSGDRVPAGAGRLCPGRDTGQRRCAPGQPVPHAVEEAFARARQAGIAEPVIMGAIPFDTTGPHAFMCPGACLVARPAPVSSAPVAAGAGARGAQPAQADGFCLAVEEAIEAFRRGELSKAVLSRIQEIHLAEPADVDRHPRQSGAAESHRLSIPHPPRRGRRAGRSQPRVAGAQAGRPGHTNPLAGSAKRRADPQEDQRVARDLLESSKDHYEHRLVIEDIRQQLAPLCSRLDVPEGPSLLSTNAMWHLSTAIDGELADSRTSALQLACRLHPTPAVCGFPTAVARQLIQRIEPFDRGLFTGMVGWCDAQGNGEWVVTIRCGTVQGDWLRLFAGAGNRRSLRPRGRVGRGHRQTGHHACRLWFARRGEPT